MEKNALSVIIPCFNEGRTILANISHISAYLANNFPSYEIVAINDGSFDNTLPQLESAAQRMPLRIINLPENCGKGCAVKEGMLAAQGELLLFLDADLAIPIEETPQFTAAISQGNDLVIASRFVPGLKVTKPVALHRKLMEHVFRWLRILIIDTRKVRDTQCGFKMFTRKAAREIFPLLTVKRFAFDSEIIFLASRKGFAIKELPVTLQNPRESHVRLLRDPFNMTLDLLRIRFNHLRGHYRTKEKNIWK